MNNKIATLRKEMKLNQTEFAAKLGIKQAYYSQIESGKKEPTMALINELINTFNVSPDWLFKNQGDMFNESKLNIDISNIEDRGTLNLTQEIPVKIEINDENQLIKVLSFMAFSNYNKEHHTEMQFDSFTKLSKSFSEFADFCMKAQTLLDAEFAKNIQETINSSTEGKAIPAPKELETIISKYEDIYEDMKDAIIKLKQTKESHSLFLQSIARYLRTK